MDSDYDLDFESDCEYDELFSAVVLRRKKIIRDRPNCFQMYNDKDFRERFRMSKETVQCVLNLIAHQIEHKTQWNNALSAEHMLLITLRFYATGSMLQTVGDLFGVSKSTASRVVRLVSHHIALLRPKFIYLPQTVEEQLQSQKDFFAVAKFPRVIAAMGCTHVRIISPGGEGAESFRNRKGFFSMNVQTLCDSQLRILDIVARWPGSTHDATIFRNSRICNRLESGEFGNGLVVADGGYENTNRIITPLSKVNNPVENLFNSSQIRTRNCVERTYGVWKRRFPVLSLGLRIHLKTVQSVIVATAVLHNLCCLNNDKEAPVLPAELEQAISDVLAVPNNRQPEGVTGNNGVRRTLIDTYFESMEPSINTKKLNR